MPLLHEDERRLQRALTLARDAAALASPNPTVGCVLALGSELLGEGAHLYAHRDHAEIVALHQAAALGHSTQGATAYVTLEPCSHHGRTGPCADAFIVAGVRRCVVATIDPNPSVSGSGLARLRSAGVEVILADPASPLAIEARRLNDAFAFSIRHHRPFVTLKAALSADGKLAPLPHLRPTTAPHWLTGPAARADVQQLRHLSDAVLTGIGTVLADDPQLTDRTNLPRRRPLLRVVLDAHLRTPLDSRLVPNPTHSTAPSDLLLLCATDAPTAREAQLRAAGADVLRLPINSLPNDNSRHDLNAVLEVLAARNIRSLLLESGSAVNGSFLASNLVDKLVLYYAVSELGPDAIPFATNNVSPLLLQQQLQHTTRATFPHDESEDIRVTGYLHDPWASI